MAEQLAPSTIVVATTDSLLLCLLVLVADMSSKLPFLLVGLLRLAPVLPTPTGACASLSQSIVSSYFHLPLSGSSVVSAWLPLHLVCFPSSLALVTQPRSRLWQRISMQVHLQVECSWSKVTSQTSHVPLSPLSALLVFLSVRTGNYPVVLHISTVNLRQCHSVRSLNQ
jgi:hypothetical protein